MNREQRRKQSKSGLIKQFLDDLSMANKFKGNIEGDWPIHDGDKVTLNLEEIRKHPGYERKLPAYRRFCEMNAGRVFTVCIDPNMRNSVVCLKEDQTKPKWLFWIGDLTKVMEDNVKG